MRVLFAQRAPFVSIGVATLAEVLRRRGDEVELSLAEPPRAFEKRLSRSRPRIVGISAFHGQADWVLARARLARDATGARVAVGGPEATFRSAAFADESIDWLFRGESESAIVRALEAIERRTDPVEIPNLLVRAKDGWTGMGEIGLERDLDSLPEPALDLYFEHGYVRSFYRFAYPIATGRGCTEECSFCPMGVLRSTTRGMAPFVRRRSPEAVVEEAVRALDRHRIRGIKFEDTVFTSSLSWLERFAPLFRSRVNLPYRCGVQQCRHLTEEKVKLLALSGCRAAVIGFETGDESFRREKLRNRDGNNEILECAERLRGAGIALQVDNLFGIPGEGRKEALATIELDLLLRPDLVDVSPFECYAGSVLESTGERHRLPRRNAAGLVGTLRIWVGLGIRADRIWRLAGVPALRILAPLDGLLYVVGFGRVAGIPFLRAARFALRVLWALRGAQATGARWPNRDPTSRMKAFAGSAN